MSFTAVAISPEELSDALRRVHPRELQVLSARLLGELTRDSAANHWGVPVPAADVLFLRAGRSFEAAAARVPPPPPGDFGREVAQAQALAAALDGQAPAQEISALAALLGAVSSQRHAVAALLKDKQERDEASPARQAETWARRVAVLLVLGLTFFFWWRQNHKEPQAPHYEERAPIHAR